MYNNPEMKTYIKGENSFFVILHVVYLITDLVKQMIHLCLNIDDTH